MLYTRKGDNGTTKTFGCDQRISKSSAIAEALGSLDEINSFLGLCKVSSGTKKFRKQKMAEILENIQQTLFIIQAEVAGSKMAVEEVKVKKLEEITDAIEKELPPVKTFFISGGTELAALFDVARTIARRAERCAVAVHEEGIQKIGAYSLAYLNRLSSVLYAFARHANFKAGIKEQSPDYK
jgi:cob(I)alamin adenosyltransferase